MNKMLMTILFLVAVFTVGTIFWIKVAEAYVRVKPYFRQDGTYIQPHYRSDPDSSRWNNWSTWGNINPFNGKKGYKKY